MPREAARWRWGGGRAEPEPGLEAAAEAVSVALSKEQSSDPSEVMLLLRLSLFFSPEEGVLLASPPVAAGGLSATSGAK